MDMRIAAVAAGVVVSSAGATTFTDRASFEQAASDAGIASLGFESFEELPLSPGSADVDEIVVDDFTLSAVNEGFTFLPPLSVLGLTGPGGTFPTDGDQHVNVGSLFSSANNNDVVVTFTFAEPQNAFFVDITDLLGLDQAPNPQAFITTDGGDSFQLLDGQGTDVLQSVGFVNASGFTTVEIRATAGDSFGLDAVSYGVIPAPGVVGLAGLAGVAAVRRRR